jgi:hypothetical protein
LPVAFACALTSFAQDPPPAGQKPEREPTTTLFFARTGESTGESLLGPYTAAIHYLEFLQIRNRWILPDIGYINFGHGNYHEYYVGGGRSLIENRYTSFDQELLYLGTAGSAAGGAKYLQPWSMLRVRFTPKFTNETVYFLYLPVNHSARFHQVLERAKFEYALQRHWKIGAGYAGVKLPGAFLINKPLLTTTISTKAGAFEFWLQKVPGGAEVQLRYALVYTSR